MKLKTFNPQTVPSTRETKPFIQVNKGSGIFTINAAAAEKLKLKAGGMLQFHQDEDEPTEWYIEVVKKDGYVVRQKSDKQNNYLIFNSSPVAKRLFDCVESTAKGGRLYFGEVVKHEGRELHTLITLSLNANR